ncbi:unnamed protein product, partial [Closterium sp. Naga37s-1]
MWEEDRSMWEEDRSMWEEDRSMWEEEDRSMWEEDRSMWEEDRSMWEEDRSMWEEDRSMWEEDRSMWEEDRSMWEEDRSMWEEDRSMWEEDRSMWEEDRSMWEEDRSMWEEDRSMWEEDRSMWEEDRSMLNHLHPPLPLPLFLLCPFLSSFALSYRPSSPVHSCCAAVRASARVIRPACHGSQGGGRIHGSGELTHAMAARVMDQVSPRIAWLGHGSEQKKRQQLVALVFPKLAVYNSVDPSLATALLLVSAHAAAAPTARPPPSFAPAALHALNLQSFTSHLLQGSSDVVVLRYCYYFLARILTESAAAGSYNEGGGVPTPNWDTLADVSAGAQTLSLSLSFLPHATRACNLASKPATLTLLLMTPVVLSLNFNQYLHCTATVLRCLHVVLLAWCMADGSQAATRAELLSLILSRLATEASTPDVAGIRLTYSATHHCIIICFATTLSFSRTPCQPTLSSTTYPCLSLSRLALPAVPVPRAALPLAAHARRMAALKALACAPMAHQDAYAALVRIILAILDSVRPRSHSDYRAFLISLVLESTGLLLHYAVTLAPCFARSFTITHYNPSAIKLSCSAEGLSLSLISCTSFPRTAPPSPAPHLLPPHRTSFPRTAPPSPAPHLLPPHRTSFPRTAPPSPAPHLLPPHRTSFPRTAPPSPAPHLLPPHCTSFHRTPPPSPRTAPPPPLPHPVPLHCTALHRVAGNGGPEEAAAVEGAAAAGRQGEGRGAAGQPLWRRALRAAPPATRPRLRRLRRARRAGVSGSEWCWASGDGVSAMEGSASCPTAPRTLLPPHTPLAPPSVCVYAAVLCGVWHGMRCDTASIGCGDAVGLRHALSMAADIALVNPLALATSI